MRQGSRSLAFPDPATMHQTISSLVASYGYVFLFLLVGIESFGIPLPGETALVTAAAAAALGRLHIVFVIAAAAAGAIVGDNGGYWLGREGGMALVRRYGRHVGLDEAKLARAHGFFERHGAKTVFIGRFIALLRSWAAALAGVSRMPYGTFTLYNALGGITWATIFGTLGYLFGRNLPKLERYVGQLSLALVLLAALVVVLVLLIRALRRNQDRVTASLDARWAAIAASARLDRLRAHHRKLWQFLASRSPRGEYLGIHLAVGFVLSVAALWIFGGVTEDVIHHDPLTLVDVQLAAWMRAHATASGDVAAMVVSAIGSPAAMTVLALVVLVLLARRRQQIALSGWVAAFVGGALLNWGLKRIVQRPRPPGAEEFLYTLSFSFPSGHTMGSLIGYGMLGYLLVTLWPRGRRHPGPIVVSALVLVLLVGLARLYLGVLYLSDAIGGYAAGAVWLAACMTGVEIALRQRRAVVPRAA